MKGAGRDLLSLLESGAEEPSDGRLLERFARVGDPAAFEALVRRHGPMVRGVCRRIPRPPHDAEDAFQATFLVLARKAASIARPERFAGWLHGVASRTARRAEAYAARRRHRERQASPPEPEARGVAGGDDLREALDRELGRLPEKYRIPIILCDLEGRPQQEVADLLGWPLGTVSGRLSRGRGMLADRLARRGVLPSAAAFAAWLAREASAAAQVASGPTIGAPSPRAAALAAGVQRALWMGKLKAALAASLVVELAASGAMGPTRREAGDKGAPGRKAKGTSGTSGPANTWRDLR